MVAKRITTKKKKKTSKKKVSKNKKTIRRATKKKTSKARRKFKKPSPRKAPKKAIRKAKKKSARRIIRKKAKKILKKRLKKVKKSVKIRKPKSKPKPKKKITKVEKPVKKILTEEQVKIRQNISNILSDAAVRQTLIEIGGENALAIVRNFYDNHSDEELAKKLKIKISDVRATLNKLHNEGLVNYMREKDSETGWYSYSWSLNHERMEKWANTQTEKLNMISDESGEQYYFCPSCGMSTVIDFESASNWDFRCERCNRLLEFIDEKRMNELVEKVRV